MRTAGAFIPALVLAACTGSGSGDAQYEDVQDAGCAPFCADVPPIDAAPIDVPPTPDATTDAAHDGAVPTDTGNVGPCTPTGARHALADETRMLARQVFMRPFGSGYTAGTFAQRGVPTNVYLTPVNLDGTVGTSSNITGDSVHTIAGGAFADDGPGHLVAYSTNAPGNLDVYLRRTDGTDAPMAATLRVSSDTATSEAPQIAALASGWVVVWRSRTMSAAGATSQLVSAFVDPSHTVRAPVPLTGTSGIVGAFDLVTDGSRAAVVYVAQTGVASSAALLLLDTTGGATSAPIPLSGGPQVGTIAGVLRTADLVVAMGPGTPGTLVVQRVDLNTLGAGGAISLTSLGGSVSSPGLALDGASGFALAYRSGASTGGTVLMVRLDTAFAPREAPSVVDALSYAGDAVRLATRGDGTYLVGWSDATPSQTTANVQLMHCP